VNSVCGAKRIAECCSAATEQLKQLQQLKCFSVSCCDGHKIEK